MINIAKAFFLNFLLVVLLLSFNNQSFALSPTPDRQNQVGQAAMETAKGEAPIPGTTCGDGSNEDAKDCCPVVGGARASEQIENQTGKFVCLPGTDVCFSEIPKKIASESLGENPTMKNVEKLGSDNPTEPCLVGVPSSTDPDSCTCEVGDTSSEILCRAYVRGNSRQDCERCARDNGVWTGMGCLQTSLGGFIIKNVMTTGIALAGVVTMLCIMYSAYMLQFSGGNPERIKKARERLTSCISGLILILFSVFVLNLIGVQILRIPGFGS